MSVVTGVRCRSRVELLLSLVFAKNSCAILSIAVEAARKALAVRCSHRGAVGEDCSSACSPQTPRVPRNSSRSGRASFSERAALRLCSCPQGSGGTLFAHGRIALALVRRVLLERSSRRLLRVLAVGSCAFLETTKGQSRPQRARGPLLLSAMRRRHRHCGQDCLAITRVRCSRDGALGEQVVCTLRNSIEGRSLCSCPHCATFTLAHQALRHARQVARCKLLRSSVNSRR